MKAHFNLCAATVRSMSQLTIRRYFEKWQWRNPACVKLAETIWLGLEFQQTGK